MMKDSNELKQMILDSPQKDEPELFFFKQDKNFQRDVISYTKYIWIVMILLLCTSIFEFRYNATSGSILESSEYNNSHENVTKHEIIRHNIYVIDISLFIMIFVFSIGCFNLYRYAYKYNPYIQVTLQRRFSDVIGVALGFFMVFQCLVLMIILPVRIPPKDSNVPPGVFESGFFAYSLLHYSQHLILLLVFYKMLWNIKNWVPTSESRYCMLQIDQHGILASIKYHEEMLSKRHEELEATNKQLGQLEELGNSTTGIELK